MNDNQLKLHLKVSKARGESSLYLADILRYLHALARLNEEEQLGNEQLAKELKHLVMALRPYAGYSVSELAGVLREIQSKDKRRAGPAEIAGTIPPNLLHGTPQEIEKLLAYSNLMKSEIVQLGVQRFGISHAKLTRQSKAGALAIVRAALEHEKTLDVIAQQARNQGGERQS